MTWVGVGVGAAASIGGAMISADAAGDAADGQREAAAQSNALQRYMYDNNVAIAQPAVNTGNAARDRLSYLLGLSPTGNSRPNPTYDQLRAELLPQYTTTQTTGPAQAAGTLPNGAPRIGGMTPEQAAVMETQRTQAGLPVSPYYGIPTEGDQLWHGGLVDQAGNPTWIQPGSSTSSQSIDSQGLEGAIQARLAQQEQQRQQAIAAAQSDPNYGRLAQQFQFQQYTPETFTPDTFSYTGQDLYTDPSYLFRFAQGQKALERQAAAGGRFLSGGQLQAAANYGQGAASQEFQNAYGRALGTFNTNEGNRFSAFNTNEGNRFGAFQSNEANRFNANQANFSNAVNPLLALSGAGQQVGANLMNVNSQYASNVGANLQGAANASGAAQIAGANAMNGAIGQGVNAFQNQQMMQNFGTSMNRNPGGLDSLILQNNGWGTLG